MRFIFGLRIKNRHTQLSDWGFIRMLQPVLHVLSDADKNLYMERITESISNGATMAKPIFQHIFQSKIYYIVYSRVKALFGIERQPVSDITVVRGKDDLTAVILANEPIQNHSSIATDFGIHYAIVKKTIRDFSPGVLRNLLKKQNELKIGEKMDVIQLLAYVDILKKYSEVVKARLGRAEEVVDEFNGGEEIINDSVEWNLSSGHSYRAHLKVNIQDNYEKLFLDRKTSPDYESVWKDGKMVGIVIIGSSLRWFSKTLLENYLSYFKEQGFQFSNSMTVSDFKSFFMEKMACEIDYFLKESHSDGDERNVFRFDRVNDIVKGFRRDEQGREEIIYLVFPKPFHLKKRETVLLSNLELGQIINEREQNGCGEITYFNTSCWSHVKARYEIEAVNSPLFLNIPSTGMSDTFLNQEHDAIRTLIHSYRNGLDFNGFRKSLKKNEGYMSGKINKYIFPDESRYNESIIQYVSIPLKIHIDLERREGDIWRSISPDQALQ